jgi:hypothetical protein
MDTLTLKLVLTPALIGAASLAGRRWGPAVSGWLVGLPLTSAPIAFFLALGHGPAFAAGAAMGTLAGTVSQALFCLAYAWLARRCRWPVAVAVGSLAFAVATAGFQRVSPPLAVLFALVLLGLAGALRVMPARVSAAVAGAGAERPGREPTRPDGPPARRAGLPAWDIPARMIVATGFVVVLTALAPALGPRLTGLLAPFPLYAAVLTVFAHHLQGPAAAVGVLRGLLLGLFAFAGFFAVLTALLERAGIGPAFAAAVAASLAVQAASGWVLRHEQD